MGSKSELEDLIKELSGSIAEFDGKSPSILSEADVRFSNHKNYVDALIALSANNTGSISSGATWLLKATIEKGTRLTPKQAKEIIEIIPKISDWSAQLHICQTLHAIPIPSGSITPVLNWLRPLISHKRPFVRAWAISAFCDLAAAHAELLDEANEYLVEAKEDSAASVRARARNITLR